jgi:type I restriction enzyme S subunit
MFETLSKRTEWPVYPLANGIKINKTSFFNIDDFTEYSILGVTNRGGGIAIKRKVMGSELTMRQYQLASANQLMWCKVDTKNGAFSVTREEQCGCVASPNMCLADIDTSIWHPEFVQFFFQLPVVIETITQVSLGSTNRQYLKPQELLEKVRLRRPPLEEQQRIVARIEQLAAQIEEARRLRHQATEETEAFLIATARHVFNTSRGWTAGRIGDYMESISTGTTPPSKQEEFYGGNVEWFTPGDIGHAKWLRNSTRKLTAVALETRVARRFAKDTLLLTCIGEIGRVGICAQESSANQQITGLLFKPDVDPEFAYFRLAALKPDMEAAAPATTLPILNQGRLEEIPFSFPSLPEQRRIVGYLDGLAGQVAALARLQSETAAELDALLPSILDKAFKGEL